MLTSERSSKCATLYCATTSATLLLLCATAPSTVVSGAPQQKVPKGQQGGFDQKWHDNNAAVNRINRNLKSGVIDGDSKMKKEDSEKKRLGSGGLVLFEAEEGERAIGQPMQVGPEFFSEMFRDNEDIWGDVGKDGSYMNFVRASTGNVDSARLLLEFSAVPSLKYGGGSELADAAAKGDMKKASKIIEKAESNAMVVSNVKRADGTTSLISAAVMGHADMCRLLLEDGEAEVDTKGANGASALHLAAAAGHVEVVKTLLEFGADPDLAHDFANPRALHFAAEMGHADVITALCDKGADPNVRKTNWGAPIHSASDANQPAAVKALLSPPCKADITALLLNDTTALMLAASKGYTESVKMLLEMDTDDKMKSYVMPTEEVWSESRAMATRPEDPESEEAKWQKLFQANMQAGSTPQAAGWEHANGATALHAAVENNHPESVVLMLQHGVRQDASMGGLTPLMTAAQYKRPDLAQVLIDFGADMNVISEKNPHGQKGTALFHTILSNAPDVAGVILRNRNVEVGRMVHTIKGPLKKIKNNKLDFNILNQPGNITVLSLALKRSMYPIVRGVLDMGQADVNIPHSASEPHMSPLYSVLFGANEALGLFGSANRASTLSKQDKDIARRMIFYNNADTNALTPSRDLTLLQFAVLQKNQAAALMLLSSAFKGDAPPAQFGPKLNQNPIDVEATAGNIQADEIACSTDNVDTEKTESQRTFPSTPCVPPLMLAARNGQLAIVKRLVERGANIHRSIGPEGASAIYLAAQSGHTSVVRFLLEASASAEASKNEKENRPTSSLVNFQLKRVNYSLLFIAAVQNHKELATLLLNWGGDGESGSAKTGGSANPFLSDNEGRSPLHIAVQSNHAEMSALLLSSPFISSVPSEEECAGDAEKYEGSCGKSQLDHVRDGDALSTANQMLQMTDNFGMTPLDYAARDDESGSVLDAVLLAFKKKFIGIKGSSGAEKLECLKFINLTIRAELSQSVNAVIDKYCM